MLTLHDWVLQCTLNAETNKVCIIAKTLCFSNYFCVHSEYNINFPV